MALAGVAFRTGDTRARLSQVERDVQSLQGEIRSDLAELKADLRILTEAALRK